LTFDFNISERTRRKSAVRSSSEKMGIHGHGDDRRLSIQRAFLNQTFTFAAELKSSETTRDYISVSLSDHIPFSAQFVLLFLCLHILQYILPSGSISAFPADLSAPPGRHVRALVTMAVRIPPAGNKQTNKKIENKLQTETYIELSVE
jgi:hypothetical protein